MVGMKCLFCGDVFCLPDSIEHITSDNALMLRIQLTGHMLWHQENDDCWTNEQLYEYIKFHAQTVVFYFDTKDGWVSFSSVEYHGDVDKPRTKKGNCDDLLVAAADYLFDNLGRPFIEGVIKHNDGKWTGFRN